MKVAYNERCALHLTDDARVTAQRMNLAMTKNYRATPVLTRDCQQAVLVRGKDIGEWTLDGYIIPLLHAQYDLAEVDRTAALWLRTI